MKIKTSGLQGIQLDYAVAKSMGEIDNQVRIGISPFVPACVYDEYSNHMFSNRSGRHFSPSTIWEQGGPIIDSEELSLNLSPVDGWESWQWTKEGKIVFSQCGPTALIAAMRCYVARKLGDIVEIPKELSK